MHVTLKLYAGLARHLPPGARRNAVELDVSDGTTIDTLIDRFQVPPQSAHLVLVNGHFVPPAERDARALLDGDVLAIWPPVAGG